MIETGVRICRLSKTIILPTLLSLQWYDHVYRNCKNYSTASTRATEQNRPEQSDTSVKETTPPLPCGYEGTLSDDKDDIQLSEWETNKTTSWCEAESNQGTASESDMKEGSRSDANDKRTRKRGRNEKETLSPTPDTNTQLKQRKKKKKKAREKSATEHPHVENQDACGTLPAPV
ncbi:uncharacterized protein LOC134180553 [Corticium candelabrum]|uniref:uncharacterized protein LOC134180553 n=1 Tax=Corticium candelabrum TaxID=121492 RepID=UPI002E256E3A|nr:uncharacterized protein LOC134180553 [Corticium candelabrum]